MIRVGLTGGIGSGKSTVARIFAALGIPVYFADTASKRILSQEAVQTQVRQLFPDIETEPDFVPNSFESFTKILGRKVFASPTRLAELNALLHPKVFDDCEAWLERMACGGKADGTDDAACGGSTGVGHATCGKHLNASPYALVEAAILIECGLGERMDKVICVETPEALQIKRTMKRDGLSEAAVKDRLLRQWSNEQRRKYADFIIRNNDRESVLAAVLSIDRFLRA